MGARPLRQPAAQDVAVFRWPNPFKRRVSLLLGRLGLGAGDGSHAGLVAAHPGRTRPWAGGPVGGCSSGCCTAIAAFLFIFFNPLGNHRRTGTVPDPAPMWVGMLDIRVMPIGLPAIDSDDFGGFIAGHTSSAPRGSFVSLPLGIVLALGRQSDMPLIRWICVSFIEVMPGCAADRVAFHRLAAAELLPAAGHGFRPAPAGDHHGDAVRLGLPGRSDPWRVGGPAQGAVRGRRQPGPRLLENPCSW